jgi:peptide/nickel transport system substrate-binding protein
MTMKSRDGFEEVNRELREGTWVEDPVSRRAMLQALGLTAAGLAAGLPLSRPDSAHAQTPKRGGTVKIGSFQNIDTLDAHNTTFITACGIHNNIYNGLLKITSTDGKSVDFKPELAREWEIQGDRVHIFRLHKGVTFHNGDPCTSADIKWNLERVKDKQQAPIHAWKLELLEAIETPDPQTIKLSFSKPYPFLRVAFTGSTGRAATILSPRAVKEKGKAYGRSPVGTGPFKFVEWKEGDFILLERYADYWDKDAAGGKLPYLDKLQIKFIIEPSTLVAALKTGEVDGINNVSPQFVADLRKDPKLNVFTAVGGNWRCLHMNLAKEPFSDKNLRKAVAFAIDRKEILERVEFGEGIIAHGPVSPPMGGFYDAAYETGKNGQYFDLEQAKQLMKQSKSGRGPPGPARQDRDQGEHRAGRRADVPAPVAAGAAVGPGADPVGRRPRPRRDAVPRAALRGGVERGQVGEPGVRQDGRGGALRERLQEAQEILRGGGEDHHRGRAGGHHAPPQRAKGLPQVREGIPDDPGWAHRHAPRLAGQGVADGPLTLALSAGDTLSPLGRG